MNGPCAQARIVKGIGLVLREYYRIHRTIASKQSIRRSIKRVHFSGCSHGQQRRSSDRAVYRLTDPRVDRTKRHKLIDVVAIAICAVICGAHSRVDVELFGKSKKEWRTGFLALPSTTPLVESSSSWTRSNLSVHSHSITCLSLYIIPKDFYYFSPRTIHAYAGRSLRSDTTYQRVVPHFESVY